MDCIKCGAKLRRGDHFICRECLVKVSQGDARRITQCEVLLKALPGTTTPRFDDADLSRGVRDRLDEIKS